MQLIEVMQGQNDGSVNAKLSNAGAESANIVVRNAVLSRIVLFVAGAYAQSRPGDLHLRRAFDLLEILEVRKEVEMAGSSAILNEAIELWKRHQGDHRLPLIKNFRDKFTAHSGKSADIRLPMFDEIFAFARDTMKVMERLALGTGARSEPLCDWKDELATSARQFWSPWQ